MEIQDNQQTAEIRIQKKRGLFSFWQDYGCGCGCIGGCIGALLMLFLIFVLPIFFMAAIVESLPDDPVEAIPGNTVYVIPVEGVLVRQKDDSFFADTTGITSSEELVEALQYAESNDNVAAIILDMDTPGGEVIAADEVYRAVKQCSKPVVVMMNSLAASGGYYIACGADKIVAHPMTMTGSIGVIMETYNYSALLDKIGVKPQFYTSGKMKAMLNGAMALPSDEQNQVVQNLIMEIYQQFVQIVSENRKIPADQIVNGVIGDGRIFSGNQAKELNLVDTTGYFEDAVEAAADLAGISTNHIDIQYHEEKYDWIQILKKGAFSSKQQQVELLLPNGKPGFKLTAGKPYLLPSDR